MKLFNKLPGFVRSPHGLEHSIWQRLPGIALLGSLLPLALAYAHRILAASQSATVIAEKALRHFDFAMAGLFLVHWMLVLGLGLGCFIVRVMKGPAFVADAYPLLDGDAQPEQV